MGHFLRLLLNIPTKDEVEAAKSGKKKTPSTANSGVSSAWTQAASAKAPAKGVSLVAESASAIWWARFIRLVFLVVLLLLAWIGVKTIIKGEPVAQAQPLPAVATFDTVSAQGTALRFARSYLTWDEANPKARLDAIALDWAGAEQAGWNGKGKQTVSALYPVQVEVENSKHAVATVAALVNNGTPEAPKSGWIGLEIPLKVQGGRTQVNGEPIITGIPKPVAPDKTDYVSSDSDLSQKTKEMAAKFFAAYAAGDVSGVIAPGSTITAPPAGLAGVKLMQWTVDTGSKNKRTAHAKVQWGDGSATLNQSYELQIEAITSTEGKKRWAVSTLKTQTLKGN